MIILSLGGLERTILFPSFSMIWFLKYRNGARRLKEDI